MLFKRFLSMLVVSLLFTACGSAQTSPTPTHTSTSPAILEPTSTPSPAVAPSPIILQNQTRSGSVDSEEIWTGTITITGDVTVEKEGTLIIEPGTIVEFSAHSDDMQSGGDDPITDPSFPNDPDVIPSQMSNLVVKGTLHAVGTTDQPIVFTSMAKNPDRGDWQSIQYHEEDSKLILENTVIEYAMWGVAISRSASNETLSIKNNVIRHIATCGICVTNDPDQPVAITISGNDISDCGHEAIDTSPNASLIIEENIIHDNLWSYGDGAYGDGVVIHSNFTIIRDNQFIRNRNGIHIFDEKRVFNTGLMPIIEENEFLENDKDIYCEGFSCPTLKP